MNILLFEDRGSVSIYLNEALTTEGHQVFEATSVNEANSILEFQTSPFVEVIIFDLNISPKGLKPFEIAQTKNGLLTGWIWFINYALMKDPNLWRRAIIFSAYIEDLEHECKVNNQSLEGLVIIPKISFDSPIDKLIAEVRLMEERLKDEVASKKDTPDVE